MLRAQAGTLDPKPKKEATSQSIVVGSFRTAIARALWSKKLSMTTSWPILALMLPEVPILLSPLYGTQEELRVYRMLGYAFSVCNEHGSPPIYSLLLLLRVVSLGTWSKRAGLERCTTAVHGCWAYPALQECRQHSVAPALCQRKSSEGLHLTYFGHISYLPRLT